MSLVERLFGKPTEARETAALEAALTNLIAHETPANRASFFHTFLAARLIVPCSGDANDATPDAPLPLAALENEGGERAMLAFSSIQAMQAWSDERDAFVTIEGERLVEIAVEQNAMAILVNIGADSGYEISREELDFLRVGSLPVAPSADGNHALLAAGQMMTIGRRDDLLSAAAVERVRAVVWAVDEIVGAYTFEARVADGPATAAIGLSLDRSIDDDRRTAILNILAAALDESRIDESAIDLIFLDSPDLRANVERVAHTIFARQ